MAGPARSWGKASEAGTRYPRRLSHAGAVFAHAGGRISPGRRCVPALPGLRRPPARGPRELAGALGPGALGVQVRLGSSGCSESRKGMAAREGPASCTVSCGVHRVSGVSERSGKLARPMTSHPTLSYDGIRASLRRDRVPPRRRGFPPVSCWSSPRWRRSGAATARAPIRCRPVILPPLLGRGHDPGRRHDSGRAHTRQFKPVAYDTLNQPVAGAGFTGAAVTLSRSSVTSTGRGDRRWGTACAWVYAQTGREAGGQRQRSAVFPDSGWIVQTSKHRRGT